LKEKFHVYSKCSITKTHVNPYIPSKPSQIPSPKESLPNSPKPSLTISIADSIKVFPESYIEISLKDSTVVSKIHPFKYYPHIFPKESLETSPKISPKESLEDIPVWSTTPEFLFLDPKREVLDISPN
jgi:hypothetical protein